ncbi:MAG TPA: Gfo/Idh/MocA family oxidoreductase [Bacteroidia bacterium]|jgi:predicted dehydrogenase
MSDHLNKKVLLVGAGQMAVDYYKVLKALGTDVTVIGRSESSAAAFQEKAGLKIITGGLENFLLTNKIAFEAAIVAVGMEELAPTTLSLLKNGFRNILVEKPGGLNTSEINEVALVANQVQAKVYVAYNRRFFASVLKAKEIIAKDGGITSFNFEFTEWSHTIEPLVKKPGVKENWLLANSSHVIDLAFFVGGKPSAINCYTAGKLSWHDKAVFSGAGKTENEVLFSYQANWAAPGRWGVEFLTANSRLILRPLEDLHIQLKGSVAINKIELDQSDEKQFKPGLYLQTSCFLSGDTVDFKTIQEQGEMAQIYGKMGRGDYFQK